MTDKEQAKGFYQKELEETKRVFNQEVENINYIKDLFFLVEELESVFTNFKWYHFRSYSTLYLCTSVTGFKELLPVLEWLEDRGVRILDTTDRPQHNERSYSSHNLIIQAQLLGDNPSCRRVPVSSKFVEQIEYKFVCDEEG